MNFACADRTSDNAHGVLSESSGLVGTDDGGVCHCLTGTENTNEEFLVAICFMEKASTRVTASRRPSGMVTISSVTEIANICVKAMPFSLAVLQKWIRVKTEAVRGKTLTEWVPQYPTGRKSESCVTFADFKPIFSWLSPKRPTMSSRFHILFS